MSKNHASSYMSSLSHSYFQHVQDGLRNCDPVTINIQDEDSSLEEQASAEAHGTEEQNLIRRLSNDHTSSTGFGDITYLTYLKRLGAQSFSLKQDYLYKLGLCLCEYGCPAHRIESNLTMASDALRINGVCIYLPSLIILTLGEQDTHESNTHILKATSGFDMYRLQRVEDSLTDLIQGRYLNESLSDALGHLRNIHKEAPIYSYGPKILAYALYSGALAPFLFRGSWMDSLVSFILAGFVGVMIELAGKMNVLSSVMEVISAIVVSFSARALSLAYPDSVCYWSMSLSGIAWLLPGLRITQACMEIFTQSIISGTINMFYAIFVALLLGFGITIGTRLVMWSDALPSDPVEMCHPIGSAWYPLLFVVANGACNVLLNASLKQWPVMMTVSGLGYLTYYYSSLLFSNEVCSILAALCIGICSYMSRQWFQSIAIAPILSGIMILVPGSFGLRGVSAFFEKDYLNGAGLGFDMIVLSVSISVGLFLANFFINPSTVKRPDRYATL